MTRPCSVCQHIKRKEIEKAILVGGPFRDVSKRFLVSSSSLHRHASHITKLIERHPAVREAMNIARAEGLAAELANLFAAATKILAEAQAAKTRDPKIALDAIARLTKLLELGHRIATTPMPQAEWPEGIPKFETAADTLVWVRTELIPQLEARAAEEAITVRTEQP